MKKSYKLIAMAVLLICLTIGIFLFNSCLKRNDSFYVEMSDSIFRFNGINISREVLKEFNTKDKDDFKLVKNYATPFNMIFDSNGKIENISFEFAAKGKQRNYKIYQCNGGNKILHFSKCGEVGDIKSKNISYIDLLTALQKINWYKVIEVLPKGEYYSLDIRGEEGIFLPNKKVVNIDDLVYYDYIYFINTNGEIRKLEKSEVIQLENVSLEFSICSMDKDKSSLNTKDSFAILLVE